MTDANHTAQSAIAQQAAEWFVTNRGGVVTAEDRTAFAAWLRSSPLHVEEYLKTAVMSRNLHAAARAMEADLDVLVAAARAEDGGHGVVSLWSGSRRENPEPRSGWRIRSRQVAAIAAAAVLAIVGAVWVKRDGQRFGLPKEFVTVHGEQHSWLLPDGTGLNLNSDSAVTILFSGDERLVHLERGQALFQVAHESGRRFRVIAGGTGVIAVGTQFDVFRKSGSTRVTVVEGKVAVFAGDAPPATARATLPSQAVSVQAGEQVQVDDDLGMIKPSVVNVQQALAWVQRQIAFEQQPLGQVAEEFSRYSAVPVVIQGDKLRDLPISGVFNAYDTESFVAFVARLDGVEIERVTGQILIHADLN